MMNQSTIDALKAMKFSAMSTEFERQLSDPSTYGKLGFEERFSLLVDAERNRRQQNRLLRTVRKAHFAVPGAMVEDNRIPQQHIIMFWESIISAVQHHNVLGHAPA